MPIFPKIWEVVEGFKENCLLRGWKVQGYADVVEANGEYHNILWVLRTNPATFKSIVTNPLKCAIKEDNSYHVVNVPYIAWITLEKLPHESMMLLKHKPQLLEKVAIYDLSKCRGSKPVCLTLNRTKSIVFNEFENFLQKTLCTNMKTLNYGPRSSSVMGEKLLEA